MSRWGNSGVATRFWLRVGPQFLPFADAAVGELPLQRLLRLSLFQVSVGMAIVLLNGTLNRVMVLELNVPAWLVSLMKRRGARGARSPWSWWLSVPTAGSSAPSRWPAAAWPP